MIKVENLKKKFIRYENKKIKKEFYADNGITLLHIYQETQNYMIHYHHMNY